MLKFENPTNGRYYYIYQDKDILGEHVLIVIRGGRNSRVMRTYGFNSPGDIREEIGRLTRLRISRGYNLVSGYNQ